MKLRTVLAMWLLLAGCRRLATPIPKAGLSRSGTLPPALLQEVERQSFNLVASPSGLPPDIRSALAEALAQSRLVIAAPSEEWSAGCLVRPGAPRQRLRFAAVGERYSVLEYEEGGFVPVCHVLVFGRNSKDAVLLWHGHGDWSIQTGEAFLGALRRGELWRETIRGMDRLERGT